MQSIEKKLKLGKKLKKIRIENGIKQKQLALKLGISFQQLQKYESGENRITAGRLWQISQILQVEIQSFFYNQ